MGQIKAVVFDLDNTLYNYNGADEAAKVELCRYAEQRFGLSPDETMKLHREIMDEQMEELGRTAASHSRMIRCQRMLERLEKPLFPHAQAMCRIYWETLFDHMEIEQGAAELLRALSLYGIKVGVGTNMTAWVQFEKINRLKLGPYISSMVTSEEAGAEKPDLKFFLYVLKKMGCLPEECLFIGDDPRLDYLGAKAAGLKAAWYTRRADDANGYVKRDKKLEEKVEMRIAAFETCLTGDGIRLGDELIRYRR